MGSHKLALGELTYLDGKFDLEAVAKRVAPIIGLAAIGGLAQASGIDLPRAVEQRNGSPW